MKANTPPKLFLKFFRWYCHPQLRDHIEGDLMELYNERVKEFGKRKADRKFIVDVLLLCRPGIIKTLNIPKYQLNPLDMFLHNLLISFRNFYRHKSSFLINLIGLSTGLTCTLMIYLWINDELSIDKYNEKDSQLYQVMQNFHNDAGVTTIEGTQGLLATALLDEMPEVEYATTVVPSRWFSGQGVIAFEDVHLKASPQFVSKDYFNVFSCNIVQGDVNNLFPDKNAICISDDLALRLFHTTKNIVGKVIQWSHQEYTDTYHITGVFEKMPVNSTTPFDILFSYDNFVFKRKWVQNWSNSDPSTFVILKKGTDVVSFNHKISGFIKSKDAGSESTLFVQRFSDRYLNGNYDNGVPSGGRIFYIQLLSLIGFFILAIACVNFMNLSTAKATRRIKEVGVKKAIGAARINLIWQYLSESAIICLISLLLSIVIADLLLPQFNIITGKHLVLKFNFTLVLSLAVIFLFTSIVAGSYPALYLSGFNPAVTLKGKFTTSIRELLVRKGLVVFQFTISAILIIVVLVVYKQMEYIQNKNLGYNKDNIISFEMEGLSPEKLETFRTELKKIPGVVNAGTYGHNLTGDHGSIELDWEGKNAQQHIDFANIEVGVDFIETMGIEFKEGHSPTMTRNPESQIILNETAIKFMGLKDPIGKKIRYWGIESEIVGVTKDFNFESLHEPIKPSFFRVYPVSPYFIVKVISGTQKRTIEQIRELYSTLSNSPFEYKFLDENYDKLYAAEQRVSVLSRYFASIAIVISCLGLLGLAAFTAEKRFKEIAIRKVLGSSEWGIVRLLSSEFTKIVIVSILITMPTGFLIAKYWLNSFAYKINLTWWYFAYPGFFTLLLAWLTVGIQALLAAKTNPVKGLKSE